MFKLVHLSDIHLGPLPEPSWSQLASKRILGYLNWKKNRKHSLKGNYLQGLVEHLPELEPDHIIVSGDLVNLALPDEFPMAKQFLETLGSAIDVTAICGNHDAYVQTGMPDAIHHWQENMRSDEIGLESTRDYPVLRRSDLCFRGLFRRNPRADRPGPTRRRFVGRARLPRAARKPGPGP